MAKGFKHGAGGGTSLNFKVVGGVTEPTNPKENLIWVNTDTPITGYVFSAVEPAEPAEGMVWIVTGTSSVAPFNALKKNGIQVYPLMAKQYVSGAWVVKTAQIYRSGVWETIASDFVAYNNGVFNSKFQKNATSYNTGSYLQLPGSTAYTSDTLFDVTPYNQLTITACAGSTTKVFIYLLDSALTEVASLTKQGVSTDKFVTYTMDISAVSGSCYFRTKHSGPDSTYKLKVSNITFSM